MNQRSFLKLCLGGGFLGLFFMIGLQSPIFAGSEKTGAAVRACYYQGLKLKVKLPELIRYIELIKLNTRRGASYSDIGKSLKQIFNKASNQGYVNFPEFLAETDLSNKKDSIRNFGLTEYKNLIIIKGTQKNVRNIIGK